MTDDKLYESMARDRDAYPKGTTMTNETKTDEPDLAERITRRLFGPSYLLGKSREGEVRALTAPIEAELAELRAFAEKFPKTADGVRIATGSSVIMKDGRGAVVIYTRRDTAFGVVAGCDGTDVPIGPKDCYSTEAAMLAAKEEP